MSRRTCLPSVRRQSKVVFVAVCVLLLFPRLLVAQSTGTFIDRLLPTDLRVMSYNVEFDSIFPTTDPVQAPKIARIIQAIQPDVINLQEIYDHSAAQVSTLMNSILPLPGGASWFAYEGGGNVVVSKYPLSLTRNATVPNPPSTNYSIALVNLPDQLFATDLYLMNSHFKCCGGYDGQRQLQADALVNWMRDARTAGGSVNLPSGTPMAVLGDLNIVEGPQPLNTIITGNIINEPTYGVDSPPDWDGTSLADLHPLQNVIGPDDYTWRSDGSGFNPGRLDYVLYTDSVAKATKSFILNTVTMTAAQLAASGLQQYDVPNTPTDYDHLPLVVDFRLPTRALGDYDWNQTVNSPDYSLWKSSFGSTTNLAADGNHDGVVDAADYTIWRDHAAMPTDGATVPEPMSISLIALGIAFWLPRRNLRVNS